VDFQALTKEKIEMKRITRLFLLAVLIVTLAACSSVAAQSMESAAVSVAAAGPVESITTDLEQQLTSETAPSPISVEYDQDDLEYMTDTSALSHISFEGDSITFDGEGVTVSGSVVTITSAGEYSISGILDDGQIVVDTQDEKTVYLILDGVDITCSTSAPIYVRNAEKTVITLADGTKNTVTDGAAYVFEDAESDGPNAAVFSKDDLTINGGGTLIVNANYNNGITSKDDLKITGGDITVTSVNDGIKGRDSIAVMDGTITVNAGGDGLQSNNDEDAEKGIIAIEGGTLDITAGLDGIQAQTSLLVADGSMTIASGSSGSADSAKGLKAGVNVTIEGGTIEIEAVDDAIHSNDSIVINGGDMHLASGDDGVHADTSLEINGGDLTVVQSYEGIESTAITINDGTLHLVASDDGINAASGGGVRGPGSADSSLLINGGYIFVNAGRDCLDVNGPGTMNDGVVALNGSAVGDNPSLDVDGMLEINGGFLVGVGSTTMVQSPSAASTQYSVLEILPSSQPAGSMIHIESEDGQEVLTYLPEKTYQAVVVSSPELENGTTYVVYADGSSTGTASDGLYSDGTYSGGTQVSSFTITSMVTGESTGMGGGRRGRP
jgi:hypothetical protein